MTPSESKQIVLDKFQDATRYIAPDTSASIWVDDIRISDICDSVDEAWLSAANRIISEHNEKE